MLHFRECFNQSIFFLTFTKIAILNRKLLVFFPCVLTYKKRMFQNVFKKKLKKFEFLKPKRHYFARILIEIRYYLLKPIIRISLVLILYTLTTKTRVTEIKVRTTIFFLKLTTFLASLYRSLKVFSKTIFFDFFIN